MSTSRHAVATPSQDRCRPPDYLQTTTDFFRTNLLMDASDPRPPRRKLETLQTARKSARDPPPPKKMRLTKVSSKDRRVANITLE